MNQSAPTATSHRYKVGDIEIIAVADGFRTAPLADDFVLNASKNEVNAALEAAGLPKDQITTIFTPIVIDTGKHKVLVDTGMGEAAGQQPNATFGLLLRNMAAAGIDPKSIDIVVISHFHGDHVNGLWAADGSQAFPNAQVTVPANEWSFWMDDGAMARAPKGRMEDLFKNNRRVFDPIKGKVAQHAWGKEVVPGVLATGTPGHSIGHTSYLVSSRDDKVFVQSDVTNHPALFVRHPGWHAWFDQDPVQAEATRRKIYDMLVAEQMPVQAFHYPFPGHARVEKDGEAYREVPFASRKCV